MLGEEATEQNLVFTIHHPAHIHLFRNAISELRQKHNVRVYARNTEFIKELLELYNITYHLPTSLFEHNNVVLYQLKYELAVWKGIRRFAPDKIIGVGSIVPSHLGALTGSESIVFTDTEHTTIEKYIGHPLADRILTPDCYNKNIGDKQIRYKGYHELAYLHPNRFTPNPSVLDEIGVTRDDRFVILRLVSWDAVHDRGHSGFTDIEDVVTSLEKEGVQVFITAEDTIPKSVEHCQISIEPHRIHDLMYYADLFVGESGTMAIESAVLGTPAIFVSTLEAGVLNELDEKYKLINRITDTEQIHPVINQAIEMLEIDKGVWKSRRENLIADKIDTTSFLIEQIQEIEKDT